MIMNQENNFLKKIFRALIFFFMSCNFTFAQGIGSYDVIKLNETQDLENILFELDANKINADDLLEGKHNNKFKKSNIDNVNKQNKHVWLALRIKNSSTKSKELLVGTSKFDYINFYVGDSINGFVKTKGGLLCSNHEREVLSGPSSFLRFSLNPNQSKLVYLEE